MIDYFYGIEHPEVLWLIAFALAGSTSYLVSRILLKVFSGDFADFKKDKLGSLYWDWLVFAPIVTAFLVVAWLDQEVRQGLLGLGLDYGNLSLNLTSNSQAKTFVYLFAVVLSFWVGYRYARKGTPKWLARPKAITFLRAYLINLPMTIFVLFMMFYLVDHWVIFSNFLGLDWQPATYLHIDGMYGLHWSYQALIFEALIALILSFAPLLMFLREKKFPYGIFYGAMFVLGILFFASYIFYLIPGYDAMVKNINKHFLSGAISQLNTAVVMNDASANSDSLMQEMVSTQ